jgi:hypothetical protein
MYGGSTEKDCQFVKLVIASVTRTGLAGRSAHNRQEHWPMAGIAPEAS